MVRQALKNGGHYYRARNCKFFIRKKCERFGFC
jgi:hypothetical protein